MIKEPYYTEDYAKGVARKRDRMGFPRDVIFEITHRCNLRCRHCNVVPEPRRKELSTKEVKLVLDQLVEAGCLHVTLTGGEPMIRKDIFDIIDYGRRSGLFIHLFTNATLITPKIADILSKFRLVSLEISFHSLKKERFDYFTQSAGSYEKVMKALMLLKKRNAPLALKINITKLNLEEVKDLKNFVNDLEIPPEWAVITMPKRNGSKDNLIFRLSPEEIFTVYDILWPEGNRDCSNEMIEGKRRWAKSRLFQCEAAEKSFSITPSGGLKPCLEFPFSTRSILDGSLKEKWTMLRKNVSSSQHGSGYRCFDCEMKNFCGSCPIKAYLECGDVNSCPNFYLRLAELTRDRFKGANQTI